MNDCGFDLPELSTEEDLLAGKLSFMVRYHPALGPLYSVMAQKLKKGHLKMGSELQLNIAEFEMINLDLDGSFCVHADQVMGHVENGRLIYSDRVGMCRLKDVKIKNQGVDHERDNIFWKNQIHRKESLKIHLKGQSLFIAENVVFENSLEITVEDGCYMKAFMKDDELKFENGKLSKPLIWKLFAKKDVLKLSR